MPMRLDEGWNQIQFNLSDFTRRAYGENSQGQGILAFLPLHLRAFLRCFLFCTREANARTSMLEVDPPQKCTKHNLLSVFPQAPTTLKRCAFKFMQTAASGASTSLIACTRRKSFPRNSNFSFLFRYVHDVIMRGTRCLRTLFQVTYFSSQLDAYYSSW